MCHYAVVYKEVPSLSLIISIQIVSIELANQAVTQEFAFVI
jgi:hypothetical protein